MGQAAALAAAVDSQLHAITYLSVHKFLAQLIPYMEHRQVAAKKWMSSRNEEQRELCMEIIRYCDKEITKLLKLQS